jgi:outer membrane protein
VIETYLALCRLSLQTQLASSRIEKYRQLQTIQRLLLLEGRINAIDTLKSHHSLLMEHELLSNLAHESTLKLIQLNFEMGSPLRTTYVVDVSSISAITNKPQFSEKYELEKLEKEGELLVYQLKSTHSSMLPTVSLNGLVGTGFSTNNKDYLIAGNPTKPYETQLNQNLYEGIGLSLNVPLFNRGEWLKAKQLQVIHEQELGCRKELAAQSLEKQVLEHQQRLLHNRAKQQESKRVADNLELIYARSLLLYQEGRITYTEIELALMDWQVKLIDFELLKVESEILNLYE